MRVALLFLSALAAPSIVSADERCDGALEAVAGTGSSYSCAETKSGVVLAETRARADFLALLTNAGEVRFRRHFGRDPETYAIVEMIGDSQSAGAAMTALNVRGFKRTLPWLTREGWCCQANAKRCPAKSA